MGHVIFLTTIAVLTICFLYLVWKDKNKFLNREEATAYLAKHCPSKEVFMKCEYQLDFISDATDLEDGNYRIEERWKVIWLDGLIKRYS